MPDVIEVQPRAGTLEPGEEEPEMEKGAVAAVDGAIQKDEKGKLTNESWKQVWQHFLKNRPLQDETNGVPLGFELEEDGKTVVCDPDTGKPKTTWASIHRIPHEEFSDLGSGLALTFRFMHTGGGFFFCMFFLTMIGWIVQLVDPLSEVWVNVTFVCDLIFVACFAGFMVWARKDTAKVSEEVDKKNITAQDYSLQVGNVPKDATAEELAKYFAENWGALHTDLDAGDNPYDSKFDATGVHVTRNDSAFLTAAYTMIEAEQALTGTDPDNAKAVAKAAKAVEKATAKHAELRGKEYHVAGPCFIAFEETPFRNECLSAFAPGHKDAPLFRGSVTLTVTLAPEPSDIMWRNLSTSKCEILVKQIVIGTFSFLYLLGIACIMAYCASFNAQHSKDAGALGLGIVTIGLLGTLGNVACCLTSIVLFMPILCILEGVHTRSMLEIIAFCKLAFFQTMGVVLSTLYVFSLDENAQLLETLSDAQIARMGSGLPTKICAIPRFNGTAAYDYPPEKCWPHTLNLFGSAMGNFLIGNLVCDIALINMLDFLCPPWFIETAVVAGTKFFQTDLNKIYEGVDFKPFMRYQILLKFVFVSMILSQIDNPRLLNLWVAICFWQSLEIEKFCVVLRYKRPPLFDSTMFHVVVIYGLPIGLLIHVVMSFFLFGVTYSGAGPTLQVHTHTEGFFGTVVALFFVLSCLFLLVWILPLPMWAFEKKGAESSKLSSSTKESVSPDDFTDSGTHDDFNGDGEYTHLKFGEALTANEKCLPVTKVKRVAVHRYIPDPLRREFGVVKLN